MGRRFYNHRHLIRKKKDIYYLAIKNSVHNKSMNSSMGSQIYKNKIPTNTMFMRIMRVARKGFEPPTHLANTDRKELLARLI